MSSYKTPEDDPLALTLVHKIKCNGGPIRSCRFSADGRFVLAAEKAERVGVYDVASGELVKLVHVGAPVICCEAHPTDPDVVVAGVEPRGENYVMFGKVSTGGVSARTVGGHSAWVNCITFLRSGERLLVASGADDNVLVLWDAETGELVQSLPGHGNEVEGVSAGRLPGHEHDFLVTASRDDHVGFWWVEPGGADAETGTYSLRCKMDGHRNSVYSAHTTVVTRSEHPGQHYLAASGSADQNVLVYDCETAKMTSTMARKHGGTVRAVVISDNGYVFSSGYDEIILVHDAFSGVCVTRVEVAAADDIRGIALHPSEPLLATAAEDGNVSTWSVPPQLASGNYVGATTSFLLGFKSPESSITRFFERDEIFEINTLRIIFGFLH